MLENNCYRSEKLSQRLENSEWFFPLIKLLKEELSFQNIIGNITEYINLRAQHSKAKIILRFGKEKEAPMYYLTQEKIRLFQSLSNVPKQLFTIMNMLGWKECNICSGAKRDRWLTWYILGKHNIHIRNPEAVLEHRIQEWDQAKKISQKETRANMCNFIRFKFIKWQDNVITCLNRLDNTRGVSSP